MKNFDIYSRKRDDCRRQYDEGMTRHRELIRERHLIKAKKPNTYQKDAWYIELTAEWEQAKLSIRNALEEYYRLEDEFHS